MHGHWLLARLARARFPDAPFAAKARAALAQEHHAGEHRGRGRATSTAPGRVSFERPYGLAWLLQLAAELREWDDPHAQRWPTTSSRSRTPRRRAPARRGCRSCRIPSAPASTARPRSRFGLMLDWARAGGDRRSATLLESRARELLPRRTATARSRTSRRARTSSRPAWPRRT